MGVRVAVSTVADGIMLDSSRRDDPEILHNREEWLTSLGLSLESATYVRISYQHGDDYCRYRQVGPAELGAGMHGEDVEVADALVTTTPGQALFLPVADCIATTLYDPEHEVLMLSHLGRHSLEQEGGLRSVQYLSEHYSSDPAKLQVWMSPAVGKDSYKIFKLNNMGMKEALHEQLHKAGVQPSNITDFDHDTATHDDYYSHSAFLRGEKLVDGRMAMVAALL